MGSPGLPEPLDQVKFKGEETSYNHGIALPNILPKYVAQVFITCDLFTVA
jgi:hypothetical protein